MAKRLALLNFISVIVAVFTGYYTQAIQLNGNTMARLSAKYANLFTPANYAFAIWGLIYVSLFAFSIYHLIQAFKKDGNTEFLIQSGYWYFIANIANALWVVVWLYELTGLSVIVMLVILYSLIKIILNTNMEKWDAPAKTIAFNWWPICFYSGWITVATIANIAAYLSKIGWNGGFLSEVTWTVLMIIIATLINLLIIYKRNMREFALVAVWSFMAIYFRHEGYQPAITTTALICAIVVFLAISIHGFKNRKSNPFFRKLN
ncbi:hypothetical protein SAMN05216480_11358 [Pustulibacterium marinum]|uniref:TspO and MBR related proteins n=1 Tax=Pustulibacterium marinum TaxID=1224947 RepID=A0A1I7I6U5_9FLAO|nr:hypothetical protein [Pustulibacterium marinum]SFU68675.1 hypothetical protein SAMN05216480_11358 [Pustulibacterium marinum]